MSTKVHVRKKGSSRLIWVLISFVVVFLVWAQNAPLDEIVRGSGTLVPSSKPQIVQSLEGGILDEINVREGDTVKSGQILARLNETRYRAEVRDFDSQILTARAKLLRLQAELDLSEGFELPSDIQLANPELAASEEQVFQARQFQFKTELASAKEQLSLRSSKVELMQKMVDRNALPELELLREKLSEGEAEANLNRLQSEFKLERSNELSQLVSDISRLNAQIEQSRDQLDRSQLLAPSDGTINTIYTTTVGGVVQSGEPIFEITPLNDEMLVEAKIQPKDIARISNNLPVTIKLSAYDYTIYGSLKGRIVQVSADTFEDEAGTDSQPYYKVLVAVDDFSFEKGQKDISVRPGMLAETEVHVGSKTVLQYLIKPLVKSREAFREP